MKNMRGNLWDVSAEAKVIPTNGMYSTLDGSPPTYRAHMGAGLAWQAALRWPTLKIQLGSRLYERGNNVYAFRVPETLRLAVKCLYIVTFPTKHEWQMPSSLPLIHASAVQLAQAMLTMGWRHVVMPQVGCGLGGQKWCDVEPLLLAAGLDATIIIP